MVSRCAAVLMAAAAVADVVQPLPVDLHALEGDASVSLLQTRMEKMRKSHFGMEAGDSVKVNNQLDGAAQASEAMKEMGEAITSLFSIEKDQIDKPKGADAIKERASLQSTAIGKASHAIEDVKQAFSKLLVQKEVKANVVKEKTEKKESKKAVSFTQSQDARIGHSSTFNIEAAADFWDDGVSAKEIKNSKRLEDSGSNIDVWDDDWKAASNAGSLDVRQTAKEGSYLSQSNYLQANLEGEQVETKTEASDSTKQKAVLSWGSDKEPAKNSLLSAETGGFPLTMAKEQEDDEETISSKKFETSDEQVVKAFAGGNVAQNSKSVQNILGDMLLSPDDQGMFGSPQEETKSKNTDEDGADIQNHSALAAKNQSQPEALNQTELAAKNQEKPNKTSLASVGSAIKSVITSVENSSWPWSKQPKPADNNGEVLAKEMSNKTNETKPIETETSSNGTALEHSNTTTTNKASANNTEIEKPSTKATEEKAAGVTETVLEGSNKTTKEDAGSGTKTNTTSEEKTSANDTVAHTSNSTDKK